MVGETGHALAFFGILGLGVCIGGKQEHGAQLKGCGCELGHGGGSGTACGCVGRVRDGVLHDWVEPFPALPVDIYGRVLRASLNLL